MRTWETILKELETEGKIVRPHRILRQKTDIDNNAKLFWLFRRIARGGEVNGIFGGSGKGKTWSGSTLISIFEKLGYRVYHTLPIVNSHNKNIIRITSLSDLTKALCREPLHYGRRIVIVIDEATMVASGSLGGMSKKLFTLKTWVTSIMRKIGGGKGACLFFIFQHNSQAAPMFRGTAPEKQDGLLLAEIYKIGLNTAMVDFPNDKGKIGFDIYPEDIPFMFADIPVPELETHSYGPSSFSVDFDMLELDEHISSETKYDPSPEHFRKVILDFFKKQKKAKSSTKKRKSIKQRKTED